MKLGLGVLAVGVCLAATGYAQIKVYGPVNGTNIVLWWPTNFTGYTLETGVDAGRTAWWAVTPAPVLIGTNNCVTNTLRGREKYYRLAGPGNLPSGMALIPAGSFTMGNCMDPNEGKSNELPTHTVYVSAFYMDRNVVCKGLWDEVYEWARNHGYSFDSIYSGQSKANRNNHPVQAVTWYDAVKWCNARSEKENRTPAYYTNAELSVLYRSGRVAPYVNWSSGYRLPTEAEWEKAARGGAIGHRFPWSDVDTISHSQANYQSSTSFAYDVSPTRGYHPAFFDGVYPYTSPVGYFEPNGYGLYDMAGNLFEWCWDWWSDTYYSESPGTDPRGPSSGSSRVIRGGNAGNGAGGCRSASRYGDANQGTPYYDIGFRSVLP